MFVQTAANLPLAKASGAKSHFDSISDIRTLVVILNDHGCQELHVFTEARSNRLLYRLANGFDRS